MSLATAAAAIVKRISKAAVVYRKVSGTGKTINPPVVSTPVLKTGVSIGDATLDIQAPIGAVGRLLAGDKFKIAGDAVTVYTITGPVQSVSAPASGWLAVPFTPVIVHAAGGGVALTFTWAADTAIRANVQSYKSEDINGTSILITDLNVKIAEGQLGFPVSNTDRLVIAGIEYKIEATNPRYAADEIGFYDTQARAS